MGLEKAHPAPRWPNRVYGTLAPCLQASAMNPGRRRVLPQAGAAIPKKGPALTKQKHTTGKRCPNTGISEMYS